MISFSFSSFQACLVSSLALFQSHGLFLPDCCRTYVHVYVHMYQMYYFADLWPITINKYRPPRTVMDVMEGESWYLSLARRVKEEA